MKREDLKKLCPTMFLVLLCYGLFISNHKVITMDTISQITLLITSGFVGYCFVDFYEALKKDYLRGSTLVWMILITLSFSFILAGKPIFLGDREFGFKTVLLFLGTNIWMFPHILSVFYLLEKKKESNEEMVYHKKHRWILFAIFFVVWGIALIAFFPGNLTSDSIDQWLQASGVREINQYHPALMTVMLKFTYQIVESPALFLTLQIAFCSYVLSTFFDYLYKKGLSLKIIYVVAIVFAILPTNQLLVISLWKDIIYTFALLWMTYFFLLLATDEEYFFSKKRHYVYFILCMILAILMRYNGIGPLVFTVIYLIYLAVKRKQMKYTVINVVMVGCVLFVNGPVLKWCGTTSEGQVGSGSYSFITNLVIRSAARAELSDRPVPAFTKKVVEGYAPMEFLTENYDPYNADVYGWNEEVDEYQEQLKDKAKITNIDAIKAYLMLFFSSPDQVILERLDGMDLIWNMTPLDSFNHRYGIGIWLPAGINKKEEAELKKLNSAIDRDKEAYIPDNAGARFIQQKAEKTSTIYLLDNLASRCGFYVGILMILLLYTWKRNKKLFAIYIPIMANTATWVLLFAYQAYRYVWYLPVLTIFIFLVTYCFSKRPEAKKGTKKRKKKVRKNEK